MIQTLLLLASRSAWSRKASLLLLLLSVITSTCLLLGIDLARQSAKASFSNAVAGTDLIVGAQTSPVSLLLYSVFRIGQATRNVPYSEFERLEQDPRVKHALPIALGDSYRGFAVVGTKSAYFEQFLYGARQNLQFAEGQSFEDYQIGKPAGVLFQAVLGAEVAKRLKHQLGDRIALSHGMQIQQTGPSHADKPFTVVGILKPTGTPVDQSVHISLAGMEAIHVDWAAGVPVPGADIPAEYVTKFNLQPKSVTAVLLALNNRAGVFRIQRELENRPDAALSAILPGVALSSLWQTVGLVEQVLLFVAALVALVSALGLVRGCSAGTITKPPPTPSNPESPPAITPDTVSAQAHGAVQFSLPRWASNTQGGGLVATAAFDAGDGGNDRLNTRNATYISTQANRIVNGRFGVRCANHRPRGEQMIPAVAINSAAL